MSRHGRRRVTRRDFVRTGTVAATGLGFGATIPAALAATTVRVPPALVTDVMKAAAAGVNDINTFLRKAASDFEQLKETKVPEDHLTKTECAKVLDIVSAVVVVVIAGVIASATFGAGARMSALSLTQATTQITAIMARLAQIEAELREKRKLTDAIAAAIQKFRRMAGEVTDVLPARDIFFHISQDSAHVTRMLEAAFAGNRTAISEMLKRDVPGSNVVIDDVKGDEGGFSLTVRTGKLIQCLSTGSRCSGKTFTLTR